jgi:2-keto-4-pentenoate hydratase
MPARFSPSRAVWERRRDWHGSVWFDRYSSPQVVGEDRVSSTASGEVSRDPDPAIIEEIAQIIAHARREGISAEPLPETLYPVWDEIYPVHDRVHELLGRPHIGWKMGAASVEVQRAEGMPEPILGRIYAAGVHRSPAVLAPQLFIGHRLCESEFVLTLGEDIPAGDEPLSRAEVERTIATVRPGLEVGDMVFLDWYGSNPFWGACLDNAGGSQLVLGEETEYRLGMDLIDARMHLYKNDELVRSGTGAAALGDPILSAAWILNARRREGETLTAGSLLSTGTCTGHCFAHPGDEMMVDFESLGTVSLKFGDEPSTKGEMKHD